MLFTNEIWKNGKKNIGIELIYRNCLQLVIFILVSVFLTSNRSFAREDDGVSVYGYKRGISGCGCFKHCHCFSYYNGNYPGAFPEDRPNHPVGPENKAWHAFMNGILEAKAVGPYYDWNATSFTNFINWPELIADYLDRIDSFYLRIEQSRISSIESRERFYSSPKDISKKIELINSITNDTIAANHKLDEALERVLIYYQEILDGCPHRNEEYNMAFHYNQGMIHLFKGNTCEAMDSIEKLIDLAEKNDELSHLSTKIFQERCEVLLDVGMYHDAIEAASKAIEKDPSNKKAYFLRALAYFETGNFDQAMADFLSSDKKKDLAKMKHITSHEFRDALFKGLIKYTAESLYGFLSFFGSDSLWIKYCFLVFCRTSIGINSQLCQHML